MAKVKERPKVAITTLILVVILLEACQGPQSPVEATGAPTRTPVPTEPAKIEPTVPVIAASTETSGPVITTATPERPQPGGDYDDTFNGG